MANSRSNLAVLRKTLRDLRKGFEEAIDEDTGGPDTERQSTLARSITAVSAEIRRAELHVDKLHPVAKTPEEHEARIRFHFEALPKPRQVEVAKALGMIAGDGTLLGR